MKKTNCDICHQTEIPLNHSIIIEGQVHCKSCFETQFSDQKELEGKHIEQIADSTICSSCKRDFGNIELQKVGAYHMCTNCEIELKKRVFPLWVKAFFAAVIVIVIVGFAWNWRYYSAHKDVQQSISAIQNGDYALAASLMKEAGEKAIEFPELIATGHYYKGIDLLIKDKSAAALAELNKCRSVIPAYEVEPLILQARIGIAFDTKDYRKLLILSESNLAYDSLQPISLLMVASSHACVFASEGDEKNRQLAYNYIAKAKAIDSTNPEVPDYVNRIQYRLYSRNIITNAEFDKKFPNGWTKN